MPYSEVFFDTSYASTLFFEQTLFALGTQAAPRGVAPAAGLPYDSPTSRPL